MSLAETHKSLVVTSLDLGKVLTKKGRIKFRASGTCMYPSIRPADILHVNPREVKQIAVGDIAVCRRGDVLFGHRTIVKGTNENGAYIVTKPDRTEHGDDGPSYDQDVLGVVMHIERKGKIIGPQWRRHPLPKRLYFTALQSFWDYREALQPKVINWLSHIQRIKTYQRLARRWLAALDPAFTYSLRIPTSSWQTHDLYRKLSRREAEGLPGQDCFILELLGSNGHRPAAKMTFIFRPPGCPFAGWWIKDIQVRIRYRGAGLEERLLRQAQAILKRWGVNELWVNSPRAVPGPNITFSDLDFQEVAGSLKSSNVGAYGTICQLRPLRWRWPG